jgi:hypothetical protein
MTKITASGSSKKYCENVRHVAPSLCAFRLRGTVPECGQLWSFQHKFCKPTIQADQEFGKCPDARLIQILQAGKMDVDFRVKVAPVVRLTRLAGHVRMLEAGDGQAFDT